MQRLYFNFAKGDVRLLPLAECPPLEFETSFPNAELPDDVTLEMISFKSVDGLIVPVITYPEIPISPTGDINGQP
jgi:hypothetical protein